MFLVQVLLGEQEYLFCLPAFALEQLSTRQKAKKVIE
jgi:hypothetical protein